MREICLLIFLGWAAIAGMFTIPAWPAGSELGLYHIRNYQPEEFRGGPQNWDIVQDSRGIIYVANMEGLLEYDGKNWRLVRIPGAASLRSIGLDFRDVIHVGGRNQFGFVTTDEKGDWKFISLIHLLKPTDRVFNEISFIAGTRRGVYFCAREKIFHYYDQAITVIPYRSNSNDYLLWNDDLVIADIEKGICLIHDDRLVPFPYLAEFNRKQYDVILLLPYVDDRILICSLKQGFFTYDRKKPAILRPLPDGILEYLQINYPFSAIKIHDRLYAISTVRGGIVLMDDRCQLVSVINKNRGLADDSVWKMMPDKSGNLWAGTNIGISQVAISSPITCFNELNGLKGLNSAIVRHQDVIYCGTFTGVYYLQDYRLKNQEDNQRFTLIKGSGPECWDFLPFNHILISASLKRVLSIENKQSRPVATGTAYCLLRSDQFPNHIFTGQIGGATVYKIIQSTADRPNSMGGKSFPASPFTLKMEVNFPEIREAIRKIHIDSRGSLWLSSENSGIYLVQFNHRNLTDYKVFHLGTQAGLPELQWNFIFHVQNELLVGTQKGIYKLADPDCTDPDKIRFIPHPEFSRSILSGNPVRFIGLTGENTWWFVRAQDLVSAHKNQDQSWEWEVERYRGIPFCGTQLFIDRDQIVWVPTIKGTYRIDGKVQKNYHQPFHTLIRRVTAGKDQDLFLGQYPVPAQYRKNNLLAYSLVQPESWMPKLKYIRNSLSFEYAAVFYEHEAENQFRYKLIGFDRDWSEWSMEAKKEYTNLPEGKYCFKVKARNIFNTESEEADYRFTILSPWYRTYWSYAAYVLLSVFFIMGLIRLNSRRLIAAKERLEKIVSERTTEVVLQRDEIAQQKNEIESYASDLYSTNRQLEEAKNVLWGEMELAKKIQTVLLPDSPLIPGYEISACMKPADEVGGDYYDVITMAGTHWIVIGDVSGHGVPAGLVMMMVQTAIHQALNSMAGESPEKILISINQTIYANIKKMGENKYMTITLLSIQEDGHIRFSGLHQDLMIYRNAVGRVELVETQGMWIGILGDIAGMIGVDQLHLLPGDALLLYTDGITESRDAEGNLYSDTRLEQVFQKTGRCSPPEIQAALLQSLQKYTCNDDVTLLILKRNEQ